jgi:DNA-binding MarR family transcriptional regulator
MNNELNSGLPDHDPPGHAGFLIRRLHQISVALFAEECETLDITPTQFGIMLAIAAQPGIDQSTAAEERGVDRATMASIVARLEQNGYIRRVTGRADRRQKLLTLTAAGKKLLAKAQAPAERATERALEPLSPRERKALKRLMEKLVEANNSHGRAKLRLR